MQELQLSSAPKIKIVFDGREFMVRKPKLHECYELEKRVKSGAKEDQAEAVVDFVVACGLPRDVVMELDVESLEAVVEVLKPKKKT